MTDEILPQRSVWCKDGHDQKRVLVELYEEDVHKILGVIATHDDKREIRERLEMSLVPLPSLPCLPEDTDPEGLLTAVEAAIRSVPSGASHRSFEEICEDENDRFRPYQERMHEVTTILNRDRTLSCLLVDLSRLHKVELDLGVAHHSKIYDHAAAVLDRMRGVSASDLLEPDDMICRSGDGDGYFVLLSPRPSARRMDLEDLAFNVEKAVEKALAPMVTEVLREQPRITVGSARVLGNSLLRPERLTARLVADAVASTRNLVERKAHRDRSTLQDIVLDDGLSTVYQPIVDLGTGNVFAYEALTRGPKGTVLESPATLFAIADEVDLTVELDRACLRGALRNAITMDLGHRLFVNLLPMSFYDSAFIEVEVGNLLTSAGLTPANIVFEITERLAIDNFTSFKRALSTYTAMGFGIAIDDVGTRHSNLETVMSLRPHFIKISDVLVRGISRSMVKREMFRSLHHIAETIDTVMIAEGIEHVEDVIALRDLGLRYGQGYYMARPAPPFVQLKDEVRAELRSLTPNVSAASMVPNEDDDDREIATAGAAGTPAMTQRLVFVQSERWKRAIDGGNGGPIDVYSKAHCAYCASPVRPDAVHLRTARTNNGEWWLVDEGFDLSADEWKDFQTQIDGSRAPALLPIGPDCLRQHPEFAFAVALGGS